MKASYSPLSFSFSLTSQAQLSRVERLIYVFGGVSLSVEHHENEITEVLRSLAEKPEYVIHATGTISITPPDPEDLDNYISPERFYEAIFLVGKAIQRAEIYDRIEEGESAKSLVND